MINTIKRMLGLHVHDWSPYGAPYAENYTSQTPIVEEVIDVDEWGEEFIDEVETGEFEIENWSQNFQDRTCKTCGVTERRRTSVAVQP